MDVCSGCCRNLCWGLCDRLRIASGFVPGVLLRISPIFPPQGFLFADSLNKFFLCYPLIYSGNISGIYGGFLQKRFPRFLGKFLLGLFLDFGRCSSSGYNYRNSSGDFYKIIASSINFSRFFFPVIPPVMRPEVFFMFLQEIPARIHPEFLLEFILRFLQGLF